MNRKRLSVSVDPDLVEWVKENDRKNSAIVQEALEKYYKEERYGTERVLKEKKRELKSELDAEKSKIEDISDEIQEIEEQLEDTVSVEDEKAAEVIEYAKSLIDTKPKFRSFDSVAGLTEDEVKGILKDLIHYAEWIPERGSGIKEDIPQELRDQETDQYETGKYGEIQDGDDFRDAYHCLSDDQREEIRRMVEEKF
jgi:post-segregation antitoxin (ccd killing protein)